VVDLDAYFARIGYSGPRDATLATLSRIHELHPAAIPFEALSAFSGEPISLDPAAIEAKLVRGGRGGWCFEQNLLLCDVLRSLGFAVKKLSARVRWNVPPNVTTARSHCLLQVTIDGAPYIADVGFGGLTLTAPLRLAPDLEQATPHEAHRIKGSEPFSGKKGTDQFMGHEGSVPFIGEKGSDPIYSVQAKVAGAWQTLYTFEQNEAQVADYEVSNWYLCNFPQSMFVTNLVAARAVPGVRHALRNNRYSVHRMDGDTQRRFLATPGEIIEVLEGPFGIRVPRSARLEEKLAAMIAANPPG
jgi:N-hydroxyarylamine O-acetyltransferase